MYREQRASACGGGGPGIIVSSYLIFLPKMCTEMHRVYTWWCIILSIYAYIEETTPLVLLIVVLLLLYYVLVTLVPRYVLRKLTKCTYMVIADTTSLSPNPCSYDTTLSCVYRSTHLACFKLEGECISRHYYSNTDINSITAY